MQSRASVYFYTSIVFVSTNCFRKKPNFLCPPGITCGRNHAIETSIVILETLNARDTVTHHACKTRKRQYKQAAVLWKLVGLFLIPAIAMLTGGLGLVSNLANPVIAARGALKVSLIYTQKKIPLERNISVSLWDFSWCYEGSLKLCFVHENCRIVIKLTKKKGVF